MTTKEFFSIVEYMEQTSIHHIHQFPVIVHEDESGGYWVECPTLDGCVSQGETIDEALRNIQEAIELCLEDVSQKEQERLAKTKVSFHLVPISSV